MSVSCEEHATAVVPYLRGELQPLGRTRLESHLGHCASCASLRDRLALGLRGARRYQPELEPAQLERMVGRLHPFMQTPTGRRSLGLARAALATAVVALLLALTAWWQLFPDRESNNAEPEVANNQEVFDFTGGAGSIDIVPTVVRHQPSAFVRMVALHDWDGIFERRGRRHTIHMTRGFVAIAFVGGNGRRLRVHTPSATVDVIGTRFVVDITDGVTTVAVAEGRVRVRGADDNVMLHTGEAHGVDAGGELVAAQAPTSARHLGDTHLMSLRQSSSQRPRPPSSVSDVLEQLARAEELAHDDQVAAAVTIFESCVEDVDAAYDPYRDLCRLQLARLLGFQQGQVVKARAMLESLARSSWDQVGREAALAVCELDLDQDACRAKTCLQGIAGGSQVQAGVADEAETLLDRWHLRERACD